MANKPYINRLLILRDLLAHIDKILDNVIKVDPYGDVIENFQDAYTDERHTRRIIKMINRDLKKFRR